MRHEENTPGYAPPENNNWIDVTCIDGIAAIVSRITGVTVEQMKSPSRKHEYVFARYIGIVISALSTKHKYSVIAGWFGRSNHSTVTDSISSVQDRYDTDRRYRKSLDAIVDQINPELKKCLSNIRKYTKSICPLDETIPENKEDQEGIRKVS